MLNQQKLFNKNQLITLTLTKFTEFCYIFLKIFFIFVSNNFTLLKKLNLGNRYAKEFSTNICP